MILQKLKAILKHNGYEIYSRPYELNIVGLRSENTIPNRFDDEIHIFYRTSPLHWNYHVYKATTDPGTYWLLNPANEQGTAILAQGQYKDAYQLGMHQGKYLALVQRKPVTVLRDYDRKALLDFYNGHKTTGLYGINIHRANKVGTTLFVDRNSAGCQVFQNANDFNNFLLLCEHHERLYGNHFTYTLIDFRAIKRENLRRISLGTGITGLLVFGAYLITQNEKFRSIAQQIGQTFLKLFNSSKK